MNNSSIYGRVDHTLLTAAASWEQIQKLCKEAMEYKMASVCIPPAYVKRVHEKFPSLNICTVVGFPLGYSTKESKVFETKQAIEEGCNEIDMVINLGDVKNSDFGKVEDEIKAIREACKDKILKVIIETCYLTEEEKIKLCEIVTRAKADYIKTSTGFGTAGAKFEDIELFKKHIGKDVKMKAAGGIRDKDSMEKFILLGCSRLGCSSAIKALE